MSGPDFSKPGRPEQDPATQQGAYDATQLRDISKLDLTKKSDPVDDFEPAPEHPSPYNPPYNPAPPNSAAEYPAPPAYAPPAAPPPSAPIPSTPPPSYPYQAPGVPPQQPYAQPGYGAAQGYPQGYQGYGYAPRENNNKAIAALVCGIAALTCCGLSAVPALILGVLSKREIDESGGRQDGRGMAIAGIALGALGIAYLICVIIYFVIVIAIGSSA